MQSLTSQCFPVPLAKAMLKLDRELREWNESMSSLLGELTSHLEPIQPVSFDGRLDWLMITSVDPNLFNPYDSFKNDVTCQLKMHIMSIVWYNITDMYCCELTMICNYFVDSLLKYSKSSIYHNWDNIFRKYFQDDGFNYDEILDFAFSLLE
jgi:hypothetical protein